MDSTKQDKAVIGARLRQARLCAGISKEEAAQACGAQAVAVDAWERGSTLPTLTQFRDLLTCYGVLAHRLLFGEHPMDLAPQEVRELVAAAEKFSPALRRKLDVLISLVSTSRVDRVPH